MNKKPLIGAHVSYLKKDQILGSINQLIKINATSGGMYLSNPRGYSREEINIDSDLLNESKIKAKDSDFLMSNIVVHAPLVGNLANVEDEEIFDLTLKSYLNNLNAMEKMNIKYFNIHPGSSKNIELGINKIAEGINFLLEQTEGDNTIILLENVVKKGNFIGHTLEQLNEIINKVKSKSRIGICIDTCHAWDSGYDISDFDSYLEKFDKIIGMKYLKALHINDSKNVLGSNKDRHEKIGDGYIGLENLRNIVNNHKVFNIPKVLETPYDDNNIKRWIQEINILIN